VTGLLGAASSAADKRAAFRAGLNSGRLQRFPGAFSPLLANMTEFGKSELLTTSQLTDIGYNVVIYPVTTLRLAMFAVEHGLREIESRGTQSGLLDQMQHRKRLYELLRYADYNEFDDEIFNFYVKGPNQ
jgi:methylisocitrate lyase